MSYWAWKGAMVLRDMVDLKKDHVEHKKRTSDCFQRGADEFKVVGETMTSIANSTESCRHGIKDCYRELKRAEATRKELADNVKEHVNEDRMSFEKIDKKQNTVSVQLASIEATLRMRPGVEGNGHHDSNGT